MLQLYKLGVSISLNKMSYPALKHFSQIEKVGAILIGIKRKVFTIKKTPQHNFPIYIICPLVELAGWYDSLTYADIPATSKNTVTVFLTCFCHF